MSPNNLGVLSTALGRRGVSFTLFLYSVQLHCGRVTQTRPILCTLGDDVSACKKQSGCCRAGCDLNEVVGVTSSLACHLQRMDVRLEGGVEM